MMTIPYFTEQWEHESLYGRIARFADRMSLTTRAVAELLFGVFECRDFVFFPRDLNTFVYRLAPTWVSDIEDVLVRYTMLPVFGPFYSREQYELVRNTICNSSHVKPRYIPRLDRRPKGLKACLACIRDDTACFGEPIWHKIHQLPDVLICTSHKIPLKTSGIPMSSRKLISLVTLDARDFDAIKEIPDSALKPLLRLAQDYSWIAEQNVIDASKMLRKRYRVALQEQGLTTQSGNTNHERLREHFVSYFPSEVLELLNCTVADEESNWLFRIINQSGRTTVSPTNHLLVIQSLGFTVEEFFNLPTESLYYGAGPWPCRNPVCTDYDKLVIQDYYERFEEHSGWVASFECDCGYRYMRKAPAIPNQQELTIVRVEKYGPVWEGELVNFWADLSLSLPEIAFRLGISVSYLQKLGKQLQLPTRARIRTLSQISESMGKLPDGELEFFRMCFIALRVKYPEDNRYQLQLRLPTAYRYLKQNCPEWLDACIPAVKTVIPPPNSVNWVERDQELLVKVKPIAQNILSLVPPERITQKSIYLRFRDIHWLQIDKLPLTAEAINSVIETNEQFALRMISWNTLRFSQRKECPARSVLIILSNAQYYMQDPVISKAIDDSLTHLSSFKGTKSQLKMVSKPTQGLDL